MRAHGEGTCIAGASRATTRIVLNDLGILPLAIRTVA
jgi:hypothetical protein